jgi:hypothetical protein
VRYSVSGLTGGVEADTVLIAPDGVTDMRCSRCRLHNMSGPSDDLHLGQGQTGQHLNGVCGGSRTAASARLRSGLPCATKALADANVISLLIVYGKRIESAHSGAGDVPGVMKALAGARCDFLARRVREVRRELIEWWREVRR